MTAKPMGKRRTPDQPYAIARTGSWEWRILAAYTSDPDAFGARFYCAVSSPHTFGGQDFGDVYVSDITSARATLLYVDPDVPASSLPYQLRRQYEAAHRSLDTICQPGQHHAGAH